MLTRRKEARPVSSPAANIPIRPVPVRGHRTDSPQRSAQRQGCARSTSIAFQQSHSTGMATEDSDTSRGTVNTIITVNLPFQRRGRTFGPTRTAIVSTHVRMYVNHQVVNSPEMYA
jgi:hypothetical protein